MANLGDGEVQAFGVLDQATIVVTWLKFGLTERRDLWAAWSSDGGKTFLPSGGIILSAKTPKGADSSAIVGGPNSAYVLWAGIESSDIFMKRWLDAPAGFGELERGAHRSARILMPGWWQGVFCPMAPGTEPRIPVATVDSERARAQLALLGSVADNPVGGDAVRAVRLKSRLAMISYAARNTMDLDILDVKCVGE